MYNLASIYFSGEKSNVNADEKDIMKAIDLYLRATRLGNENSLLFLIIHYKDGYERGGISIKYSMDKVLEILDIGIELNKPYAMNY